MKIIEAFEKKYSRLVESSLIHFLIKNIFYINLIKFYEIFSVILISFWVNRLSQEPFDLSLAIDFQKLLVYLFSLITILLIFIISTNLRTLHSKAFNRRGVRNIQECYENYLTSTKQKLFAQLLLFFVFFTFSIVLFLYGH